MATTKVINSNNVKNTGGTFMIPGTNTSADANNHALNLSTSLQHVDVGAKVKLAVSPTDSGNLGTFKPISTGVFANPSTNHYIGQIIGDQVAGVSNTILRSPANSFQHKLSYARGYHRLNITDWSYTTGVATKGGNAGDLTTYHDPINNTTVTTEVYPSSTVPGEFCYMSTGSVPSMSDYSSKNLT